MPYIARDAENLVGKGKLIGSGQCVALVQEWAGAPNVNYWVQGIHVRGAHTIQKGTVIATFVNGRYPSNESGNHAAIYISQDQHGIQVIDQWNNRTGPHPPSHRTIRFNGGQGSASDDGDQFSVVE